MKISRWVLSILLFSMGFSLLESACAQSDSGSPSAFVQSFYDWYTPLSLKKGPFPAIDAALNENKYSFSQELYTGLREDEAGRRKFPGYIAGLDFDPFLAAQDPCDKYEVGDERKYGDEYRVSVFGVCEGQKHENPDVVVELGKQGTRWVIINFLYPNPKGGDLITVLKLLKEERERAEHKKK